MRERGVQSRRGRAVEPDLRRPTPPSGRPGGGGFWQALAIVALIVATAGWTTVAVLALRPPQVAEANPTDGVDPSDLVEESEAPVVPNHTLPALEALLPAEVSGTALTKESWTGDELLPDDPLSILSENMTDYLTSIGKTPTDLQVAIAYDPTANADLTTGVDLSIRVLRADGADAVALRDNQIDAWLDAVPELVVTTVKIGDKQVTKGDFGPSTVNSWWYVTNGVVYDVETSDEALATAALGALPKPSGSPVPAYSAPPASAAPSGSPAASAS